MSLPRHPDTIPGLAPDCRRVLRDDYMRIQVAATEHAPHHNAPTWDGLGRAIDTHDADIREFERGRAGRVAAAVAEYRRTADLWGVEV